MSYESYETPTFSAAIWYYGKEYSRELPEKLLSILEHYGFYPPKKMNALINVKNGKWIKSKTISPPTKDMTSSGAREFWVNTYLHKDLGSLSLTNSGNGKNRNENFWFLSWLCPSCLDDSIVGMNPNYTQPNILSIDSTYERLENVINRENFFSAIMEIIDLIRPYYARIEDVSTSVDIMDKTKEKSFTDEYLQTVYWGNYFGEKLCKDIGIDKLINLPVKNKRVLGNGFFFTLTDNILDSKNNPNFKLRNKIYKYLNPISKNHMAF